MLGWSTSLSRTGGRPSPVTSRTSTLVPAPMTTPPRSYCQSVSSSGTGCHPSPAGAADTAADLGADVGCGRAGTDRGHLDVGVAALLDDDNGPGGAHVGQAQAEAVRDVREHREGRAPLGRAERQVGLAVGLRLGEADDAALGGVHAGADTAVGVRQVPVRAGEVGYEL